MIDNLIFFNLAYFNLLLIFLILFLPFDLDSFYSLFSFFPFSWNGDRNWWSPVLGVWNGRNFLFLPSFFYFIYLNGSIVSHRALRFIASGSSCVWLFYLSTGGLVGIASLMRVPHSVRKWIPLCFARKTG